MRQPKTLLDVARMPEDDARAYLESLLWPDGPVCPHCGVVNNAYTLKGKKHRAGLYKCRERECRKQFTVSVGTVMHRSHIPMATWATAFYLMNCHKKSISARQLRRDLGIGSTVRPGIETYFVGNTDSNFTAGDSVHRSGYPRGMV